MEDSGFSRLLYHIVDRILLTKSDTLQYTRELLEALEIREDLETLEKKLNEAIKEQIGIISVQNVKIFDNILGDVITIEINYL